MTRKLPADVPSPEERGAVRPDEPEQPENPQALRDEALQKWSEALESENEALRDEIKYGEDQ